MKEKLELKIAALTKKAKESDRSVEKTASTRSRSSLHKVIKTKEQADAFMKLLKSS